MFEFITEKERLSEEEASLFIKQVLLGVQHMHNQQIAHLDLKVGSQHRSKLKLTAYLDACSSVLSY